MGSPLELRTVVSSSRGATRKYETGETAPSAWAKLGVGAIILAGMTLAKKLLFPSPALADGADDDAIPDGSSAVAASDNLGTADDGVPGQSHADKSDGDPSKSPGPRARASSSPSEAPLDAIVAEAAPAAAGAGQHGLTARASNDNISGPPPSAPSNPTSAAHHGGTGGGGSSAPTSDARERDQAPVVNRAATLRSISANQALLISLADLLQGVTDPDGDALSIGSVTTSSGHVVSNEDGTWTFTPAAGDSGDVVLTYAVTDGHTEVVQIAKFAIVPVTVGETVTGTAASEQIVTHEQADTVTAGAGDDVVYTAAGADRIEGGPGNDMLFGGDGDDVIYAGSGNDVVSGGAGNDRIFGEDGNDRLLADRGNDIVEGGAGNDVYLAGTDGTAATPTATAGQSDGNDVFNGGEGSDTYDAAATTSPIDVDLGQGTASGAEIGQDTLVSVENVVGGSGNDVFVDSAARNVLTGGGGADLFCFTGLDDGSVAGAKVDQITDFETGDRIDISRIDADKSSLVSDGFEFLGELNANSATLLALKQLGFRFEALDDGEHTLVYGRTSELSDHDFSVDLTGHHELTKADFIGLAS